MSRILAVLFLLIPALLRAEPTPTREAIARAALAENNREKRDRILELAGNADETAIALFDAWKRDELFIYTAPDGTRTVVQLIGTADADGTREAVRVADGKPLLDVNGTPLRLSPSDLKEVGHNGLIRRAMKEVIDLVDLSASDPARRLSAVQKIGLSQDARKLPPLLRRLEVETDPKIAATVREAIALIRLKDPDAGVRIAALDELRELHTLASYDFIRAARTAAEAAGEAEVVKAADRALRAVESHRSLVNFLGTLFRGVSLGSILLVVALGLAITFGLMGVINMAHGEMIAVGAYTTYLVQNIFGGGITLPFFGLSLPIPGLGLSGWAYESYFLVALPVSFCVAAIVGIGLERSIIQFLYRRPLESLLATWGVSLLLQQVFRLMFGANNVQVSSPAYLAGNWTVADIIFGWNRVFVIVFAILIVFGVWLVLTRTPLGLLIRAVMQNRTMASCMGVHTERVNMLTFGIGSGLAGLAGAFLSQIGNVGPSLGQSYIVDSFMVVVVGGVGNIAGTVASAFAIGGIDQVLQQYLPAWAPGLGWVPLLGSFLQNLAQDSSVFGKILVLGGIILFLQWRPAGLFVTRSRGLEN
ncbi:MAG: urea ABC transporter permease subunit UrtB [Verrucomicrobia bacterium]|nr:MAG: urea ABC transporter permease subunit UrtB [Verrucomicrobiota bacterium]